MTTKNKLIDPSLADAVDALDRLEMLYHLDDSYNYAVVEAYLAKVTKEHDRLLSLSVENIRLEVVPGENGLGEEVYAKSVHEVVQLLSKMAERIDELESKLPEGV